MLLRNVRDYNQTLGNLLVFDDLGTLLHYSKSMELPWEDNERNISCVPAGMYKLVFEYSDRFKKKLWELKGVIDRSECKIHAANYARQLNGCISPGREHLDIDGDGARDVTFSGMTLNAFHTAMQPEREAIIHIIDL